MRPFRAAIPAVAPLHSPVPGARADKARHLDEPRRKGGRLLVFVDELTILTDTYQTRFDGENLAEPDHLNQLWQQAKQIGDMTMKTRLVLPCCASLVLAAPLFAQTTAQTQAQQPAQNVIAGAAEP